MSYGWINVVGFVIVYIIKGLFLMILENVLWMLKCLGVFDGKFILSYNIVGIVY